MHWLVLGYFLTINVGTYLTYGWDKYSAKKDWDRVPENVLHWAALLGGWPGALAAQRHFRHKTVKPSFQRMFWLTVIANVVAVSIVGWLWLGTT